MDVLLESQVANLQRRKRFIRIISWVCLGVVFLTALPPILYQTWRLLPALAGMSLFFSVGIYLNSRGYVSAAGNLLTFSISLLLFISCLQQGNATAGYLYYLPLIMAIPFFIEWFFFLILFDYAAEYQFLNVCENID